MTIDRRTRLVPARPEATEPLDPDLEAAARAFVPDAERIAPIGNGRQAGIEAASGAWVVRRWPDGTTDGQVRFVHDLLRTLRTAGIDVVPDLLTAADGSESIVVDGVIYDAQQRLPGTPFGRTATERGPNGEHVNIPSPLSDAARAELIQTVARVHLASESLARVKDAPAVTLAGVAGAVRDGWEGARLRLRAAAPTAPAIQRWIRAGERSLRPAIRDLAAAPAVFRGRPVVCHGDLWPAHVLWAPDGRKEDGEQRLSGIVDWSGAAAGSPLLDLAQLVTHFGGWTTAAAEEAIGAYAAVRRLDPDERRLLPAAATLDLIAEAGWLLTVAYGVDERSEPLSTPLQAAIDAIVTSLEQASAVALRGDQPAKPVRRQWIRRPPAAPAAGREGGKAPAKRSPPPGRAIDRRDTQPPVKTPRRRPNR